MITIKLQGAKELERKLKRLPVTSAKKVIRQSLRLGAKVEQAAAKSAAPVKTGLVRSAIRVRAMKRSRNRIGVLAQLGQGLFKGKSFYGAFVEFGHRIGKRLAGRSRGQVPPHPFLKDAFDASTDKAAQVVLQAMKAGIEREAQK